MRTHKRCTVCKEEKESTNFSIAGNGYLSGACKPCINIREKERIDRASRTYYQRHREAVKAGARRWQQANKEQHKQLARKSRFKQVYGVTPEWYAQERERQNFCCAICSRPEGRQKLNIDHDHRTKKVRGLICGNCNRFLGYAHESIETLEAAIAYLRKSQA